MGGEGGGGGDEEVDIDGNTGLEFSAAHQGGGGGGGGGEITIPLCTLENVGVNVACGVGAVSCTDVLTLVFVDSRELRGGGAGGGWGAGGETLVKFSF